MAQHSKIERLLGSKTTALAPGQYHKLLCSRFDMQMKQVAQQSHTAEAMEVERARNTSEVLSALGVDARKLLMLERHQAPHRGLSAQAALANLEPRPGPYLPILPGPLFPHGPAEPQLTQRRVWLEVTSEVTTLLGDAAVQWLSQPNSFHIADKLEGSSTGGGLLPYHRKTKTRSGGLLSAVPYVLDRRTRLDSVGVYFTPVDFLADMGSPEGNWYAAAGLDVNVFYPPSVAEVQQSLHYQVAFILPDGSSQFLLSDADEPGPYVKERETGGDSLEFPLPSLPKNLEFPVGAWYPAGTEVLTYLQLTYSLYTRGQGALATMVHNLSMLPFLIVATED